MRRFIVRKDDDSKSSLQTKNMDPLSFTERTVFFKKNSNPQNQSTIEDIDRQDAKFTNSAGSNKVKDSPLGLEAQIIDKESLDAITDEKPDNNSTAQSKEIKKLFDESMRAVKEFDESKMKLLYSHLEGERQLTKQLNETLHENLAKVSKIGEDLEHRKNQLEVEVDEKTKRILDSEKMAAIGELSARLAHDIKNPLTTIKNSVKLLRTQQGKSMDEYVMKRFDSMDESVFRISHQIDGVLDYLKKTPLKTSPASLIGVLKSSIVPLTIPNNIAVNFPSTDLTLSCEAIKMEIVFGNILLNSIQAIGGNPGQIYVRYVQQPDWVVIEIVDSGSGIAPENVDKIFNPLFTTKQQGTGLGLTSCKNIVEQHGGKISVKNTPTTVTIMLPQMSKKK
ncbi:MAG: sensor histidine kinase [Nitrososphaerota archaeon]